ncbi:MAG: DUF2065 domain-containing protein [Proteobacteria bacterium]|nr:DUF2065 domain-containing protein [Pseudomonadota bacterium]
MDHKDLLAAVCLLCVFEGLLPLLAPRAWKQALAQLLGAPDHRLRIGGGVMVVIGLLALQWVRGL